MEYLEIGDAKSALEAVTFPEALLHGMQLPVLRHAFDGGNFTAVRLHGEDGAGLDREPVDVDDTGAALAGVAADMRAGEAQLFANVLNQ